MAPGDKLPDFLTNTPLHPTFDKDMRDTHLVYDYDAQDKDGNPEKWRYELWCFSDTRVVYAIHGGPMAGASTINARLTNAFALANYGKSIGSKKQVLSSQQCTTTKSRR